MKSKLFVLVTLALLLALPLSAEIGTAKASSSGPDGTFELSLTVTASESDPTQLTCVADLRELDHNSLLAAPKLVFQRGTDAKVETTTGSLRFTLTVSNKPGTDEIVADGVLSKSGKDVFAPRIVFAVK